MRFYDTQSGSVRIDGIDLRDVKLRDLRRTVSMVPQEVTLFSGTIRDNIAFGAPGATLDEVMSAARAAEAHGFIQALPDGYDTLIGFGGSSLSGGQRQRIAIARALLPDCAILVFDEATSALDYETEAALQRSLNAATEGRTTIIIAHRLSTVRHADNICVLEEGVLVEQGSHDELVEAGGLYANMWRVQTGEALKKRA
jgi:ATP-binding cassette subfamily B protein